MTQPIVPTPYLPDTGALGMRKLMPPPGGTLIDLSLNESSWGASPAAVEAARARAEVPSRYPDPMSTALREAIGAHHAIDPEQVICGNGSEELLDVIARCYARPGDEVLFPRWGFAQFGVVAMRVGATAVKAEETAGYVTDVDALLAAVTERTRIVFVANPNNPTGTILPEAEVTRLVETLPPHIVLVLDSAYAEYPEDPEYTDGMAYVAGRQNVVVTRTFSKGYGLAALRVGWAYGPPAMIRVMNTVRGVGNVNAVAQEAALAALADQPFLSRVRRETAVERTRLFQGLGALGLAPLRGACNFLLIRFPADTNHTAAVARRFLLDRGIVVNHTAPYGLDGFVRCSVGLPQEVDAVLAALGDFMV